MRITIPQIPGSLPASVRILSRTVYLFILFASIAISWKVHTLADLRLPPPWPDESAYLWQAVNVAERTTMFAPQLNPERIIMWTVPGYQVFMGLIFKIIPFSLQAARTISWLLVLLIFLGILWLFREHHLRHLVLVAAAFFYLGAPFVVLGNIARMEALLLLLVVAAFAALQSARPYRALALLLLTCLIHPNGGLFLVAALVYVLWQRMYRSRPQRLDIVLLAVAFVALGAYAIFAALHWQALLSDVGSQFSDKAKNYSMIMTLQKPGVFASVVLVLCVAVAHRLLFRRVKPSIVLSLALLLPQLVADELFYGIYTVLAYLIAIPLAMEVLTELIRRWRLPREKLVVPLANTLAVVCLLVVANQVGFAESPFGYPRSLVFGGMRLSVRHPYLTAEDRAAIIRAVQAQLAGSPDRRVQFYPAADGLLFWPERERDFVPYQPIDTSVKADAIVLHMSWYFPDWWQIPSWSPLAGWWHTAQDLMTEFQLTDADIVRMRDRTEVWYVKRSPW